MRKFLAIFMIATLVGCVDVNLVGLEDFSEFLGEAVDHGQVATVVCGTGEIAVGEFVDCKAFNEAGTVVSIEGFSVVRWVSSDPAVARVDLAGSVQGLSVGTATITGLGPRSSSGEFVLSVVE